MADFPNSERIASSIASTSTGPSERLSFSCSTCRARKVRCDKQHPCSNCVKAGVECVFLPPTRGKRKRTKPVKEGLHAKLKRYKTLLESHGVVTDASDGGDISEEDSPTFVDAPLSDNAASLGNDATKQFSSTDAKIVHEEGSSRYYDNGLWLRLGKDFEHPPEPNLDAKKSASQGISKLNSPATELLPPDCASDLILPRDDIYVDVQDLNLSHPPLDTVRRLWECFLERLDPLFKVLHAPTFWSTISDVLRSPHEASKSQQALVYSVYAATLNGLDEEECQTLMGDHKAAIVSRYRSASRQALVRAAFVKTSTLMTLQAYVLFLVGMRGVYQSDSMYILCGIAVRLARRMGLHRDGTSLGLSPFETEMRRRLWWQIVHMDSRISDFSGTKPSMDLFMTDSKPPLNVFDDDLRPDMVHPPPERSGITPVVLTIMKCDIGDFFRKIAPGSSNDASWHWERITNSNLTSEEKDILIDRLQDLLERKYLRYCDPSDSLHLFASVLARSAVCKMRLFAHNPRQLADQGLKLSQRDRDIIFSNGTKLLEYGNLLHSNAMTKKYAWQVGASYIWDTLLYVLMETRHRKTGPTVDKTWQLIDAAFKNYPQVFQENTDVLFVALGGWTIQVWDDCAAARKGDGLLDQLEPDFIAAIRRCRRPGTQRLSARNHQSTAGKPGSDIMPVTGHGEALDIEADLNNEYDFSILPSFDLDVSEWAQWERFLAGPMV